MDHADRTRLADRIEAEIEALDWALTNHRPTDAAIVDIERIRALGQTMARLLVVTCPPGPEYELAKIRLQETVMWAVGAIARVCTDDQKPGA